MKKPIVLVIALVVSAAAVKAQSIYSNDSLSVKNEYAYSAKAEASNDRDEMMPALYAQPVYIMDEATPAEKSRLRKKKRLFSFLRK